ncbi:MAG: DUF465 domain-containing protein [Hyphomicrobiaceae bacterium]|nr:DUF465 domain-containing protein [Hyphomicrobiaceae bacterium]
MTLDAHLSELERRHQALEKEIEVRLHQPAATSLEIAELKRKKLSLKDEIMRLKRDETRH